MKLRIGDTEYDYQTALNKASLGVLMDLKSQGGPGRRSIELALHLLNDALLAEEADATDAAAIWDDDRVMAGMVGLVFICKRHVGESISWAEAGGFSWDDLQFIPEAGDVIEADPTSASGEANPPDAETKNVPTSDGKTSATGTSKTSKKASTAA